MKRLIKARSHALKAMTAGANIFEIMAYFAQEARERGWPKKEIDNVIKHCQTGTYTQAKALMAQFYEKDYKKSLMQIPERGR